MPPRTPDWVTWRRNLAAGRISPVYLVHGEEAFLKEEAVRRIREAVLAEDADSASWNLTVLEGGGTSLPEILDAARTLPMLAPRRLIWVKEAEKLRDSEMAVLREYLQAPVSCACIIFTTASGKADFRRALFKTLQVSATVLECQPLRGSSVHRWIQDRVKDLGAEIDPEGLTLLEMQAGPELLRLDQELKKVLDFIAPRRQITSQALGETLGTAAAGSVFEWVDQAGAGETGDAIRLLRGLAAEGEEPVRLLFLLTRHLRMLILGQSLLKAGQRGKDLASALGFPPYPFLIEKMQRQIQRFPPGAGDRVLRRLLEADRALKSGSGKPQAVLEKLMLDLASLVHAPRSAAEARG